MPPSKKPIDPKIQADIDYVSLILAKGISGFIEVGLTDGFKIKNALDRIVKSKAGVEAMAGLWSTFWNVNPRAMEAVEMAAAINPKFREFLEKMNMKAKEIPPEDVDVKTAERV